ncbi:hypothetical protein [Peribacillus sp. SCS-155]|uniref:hypothetical protein n=1 Tax=Peribacillus sedimenti TaxID=3115297 RepID=UPI00390623F0
MEEGVSVKVGKFHIKSIELFSREEMIFRKKKFFVCSVCGCDCLPGPLYGKEGNPDVSLICACYGFQPGYDDEKL